MTPIRGLASMLVVALAGAIVAASPAGSSLTSTTAAPRLKAISSRVNAKGASLVIEATDPVAYVATRPDPLTLVLEFRNVTVDAATTNGVSPHANSPIAAVDVEPSDALGAPASRVRIALTDPVAHHVRSDRNTLVVDFDKPARTNRSAGASRSGPGSDGGAMEREPSGDRRIPDAMQALRDDAPPAVDPISALGLNKTASPVAPPAPAASAAPVTRFQQQSAVQTPPSQAPTVQAPTGGGEHKFTGHPISLDFQGADLRAVLRTFAEISGLNIVIDPAVQGTVDVALRDVPWDQALDIILRANKLGYSVDGTIVRIAPIATLAAEEKERSDLAKAQAEAGQVATLTRQLSYAKGEEIATLLKQANVLSPRGQAFVDARTNTLIITDLQDRLQATTDLIATIDKPQPQVEIEARIVQTNKNYARALGVQWGFNGRVDPALGNGTNMAFPNNGALGGGLGATVGSGTAAVPAAVNLAAPAATSAVGLALGSVNGAFNLDVALSALEQQGNGRILSTPRVTTQNNIAAEMTQGIQIPIQTVANNTVTVTFRDAALTLKVTPQITAANTVIMQIAVENSQADFSRAVNGIPPINTQRANTSVLVTDGQTTVIGGIYVSQEQAVTDRTPGLGQIPLLKWLFKRESINDQNTELLIFITPRILKS